MLPILANDCIRAPFTPPPKQTRLQRQYTSFNRPLIVWPILRTYIFALLSLLNRIALTHRPEHTFLRALLHLSRDNQFVQYRIRLLKVKDQIQLANIPKVSIQHLDVAVDDFERNEFVIALGDARDEEEGGVAAIDYFGVFVFEKVAHSGASGEDELGDVFGDFELGFGRHGGEPFSETHFALAADEEDPVDLSHRVRIEED